MEENKINMPPPPKELRNMPPPPPKQKEVVEEKSATTPMVENVPKPVGETSVSQQEVKTEGSKPKEKEKVEKVKHKPVGGIRTVLYWLGFVLSLGAVGVLIYLLVK